MEYRRKCTVCGKIYCYTDSDVFDNNADKVTAALSGIATVAQLFGGTMLGAYAMSSQRDRYDQRVKDFTRCPYCNSQSTITLTHEQWLKEEQKGGSAAQLPQSTRPHVEINANATTESLLKRVLLFLEDSEWETADAYCDKILDVEPENSMAYLGKLMAETHSKNLDGLSLYDKNFEESGNFKKAVRFAAPELKAELNELVKQRDYSRAMRAMVTAKSVADYNSAALKFRFVSGYLDSDARAKECSNKAKEIENTTLYSQAKSLQSHASIFDVKEAKQIFETLGGWKDSKEQIIACQAKIEELTRKETEAKELAEKKKKTITVVAASVAALVVIAIAAFFAITKVIIPSNHYKQAEELLAAGKYDEAIVGFTALNDYKDSRERIKECNYRKAELLMEQGEYDVAILAFRALGDYRDSPDRIDDVNNAIKQDAYDAAEKLLEEGQLDKAEAAFIELGSFSDSQARLDDVQAARDEITYSEAERMLAEKRFDEAEEAFAGLGEFKDAPQRVEEVAEARRYTEYQQAVELQNAGEYEQALDIFNALEGYSDCNTRAQQCAEKLAPIAAAAGQTEKAAILYQQAGNMENALPLMYRYVITHLDSTNSTTFSFLQELKNANYRDSSSMYERLYMIMGKIIFNTDANDNKTELTQMSWTSQNYKTPYFHVILNGPPEETILLKIVHEVRTGDSEAKLGEWVKEDEIAQNVSSNVWFNQSVPTNSARICYHRYSIYIGTEMITSATLKVTYNSK